MSPENRVYYPLPGTRRFSSKTSRRALEFENNRSRHRGRSRRETDYRRTTGFAFVLIYDRLRKLLTSDFGRSTIIAENSGSSSTLD